MPYIYKIINDINDKIYIGKTQGSIEKRFKQHCHDAQKICEEKRPLYSAMRKYGTGHFSIEKIEECDESILSEREKFWIEYYQSFKKGYNATLGGDGSPYLDYDLIVETYRNLKSCVEVAKELNVSSETVHKILKLRGEQIYSSMEVMRVKYGKPVNMYTLDGNYIKTFPSMSEAAQYLIDNNLTNCKKTTIRQHISEVCRGKRQTAAKFKWKQ